MQGETLWQREVCPECLLYEPCGGAETSPCTCIRSGDARYDCENCDIVCRDRHAPASAALPDTLASHASVGRDIEQVAVNQSLAAPLPLLIPMQTNKLPKGLRLSYEWIGVDLNHLFDYSNFPGQPHGRYESTSEARAFLRAREDTKLVAVLNARDRYLERFWASDRQAFYEMLLENGFAAATGPTFSVYKQTSDNSKRVPDSHTVTMLRRHHRVVEELSEAGITPLPNLYSRNERDRRKWIAWLAENPTVSIVSCDFTCTKTASVEYRRYLDDLAAMLAEVGRPLHVLLQGIGNARAAHALIELAEAGCTCSFTISDPIIKGRKGRALLYHESNEPLVVEPRTKISRPALARKNVEVMRAHLSTVARGCPAYQ